MSMWSMWAEGESTNADIVDSNGDVNVVYVGWREEVHLLPWNLRSLSPHSFILPISFFSSLLSLVPCFCSLSLPYRTIHLHFSIPPFNPCHYLSPECDYLYMDEQSYTHKSQKCSCGLKKKKKKWSHSPNLTVVYVTVDNIHTMFGWNQFKNSLSASQSYVGFFFCFCFLVFFLTVADSHAVTETKTTTKKEGSRSSITLKC